MYSGKDTEELQSLRKEYRKLFGTNPDGEMELEFGTDYNDYLDTLQKCVDLKKDMFEVLGE